MQSLRQLTFYIDTHENELIFDILDENYSNDYIKQQVDNILNNIKMQCQCLNSEIQSFNATLPEYIKSKFQERKTAVIMNNAKILELGVPIRNANLARTYAVEVHVNDPEIAYPEKPKSSIQLPPSPTLANNVYQKILLTIDEMGASFEQTPKTYIKFDETDFRNQILHCLQARTIFSVTGESYNKEGKTDILIKNRGINIFAAECKIWAGKEEFLKAIDQILSYLTHRDSKAALLIFVRLKNFDVALDAMNKNISTHK
jgi:hypothetical protein